jgi:flavin reductase (DIM6/NTAB) family NADH-FMN oxidoreductase RutF
VSEAGGGGDRLIVTSEVGGRDRYQLLTSLLVPRPIGWLSTRSSGGVPNLAPFSYYAALSATPMLVAVSIGSRGGAPKDSLANIRETGEFCVNVVTERHLAAMNESSAEHPPEVDEFAASGVRMAEAELVDAPYVAECPAVFECRLFREVELGDAPNALVIGEVLGVRLAAELPLLPGTHLVDPHALRPVGRLGGDFYGLLREVPILPRPKLES